VNYWKGALWLGLFVVLLIIGQSQAQSRKSPATRFTKHDFVGAHFIGSKKCRTCHDGIKDKAGNDLSIVRDWRATIMANAARDPFWQAKVASEMQRTPKIGNALEKKCSRCHMPMAHVEATLTKKSIAIFGPRGFLDPSHPLFDFAMEGVSCTLCHQIEDDPSLGESSGSSGGFIIGKNIEKQRKIYGPFKKPFPWPMRNILKFTPTYSPHISQSKICSSCHDLNTHAFNSAGEKQEIIFPEQSTYSEWRSSDFAREGQTKSCQDCHMSKVNGKVIISNLPPRRLQGRSPFRRHIFVGGNTYMLDILQRHAKELGVSSSGLSKTIERTRELLKSAVTMSVKEKAAKGFLQFIVSLKNHSGHKFPSGFPSRRAWLYVQILDSEQKTVFESGAVNNKGQIKAACDHTEGQYEVHHELISKASQVQIYESNMKNLEGQLTFTLIRAAGYLKDNRLLPLGMNKSTVASALKPVGEAMKDKNYLGGSDQLTYKIPLAAGRYRALIELRYQSLSSPFAQDLFKDAKLPRVAAFQSFHKAAKIRYETIQSITKTMKIP
jgi:hypothetical protein